MAKVSPLQSNFNGGEVSPLMYGRVENARYATAMAICQRYIPTIQGGLNRCPGSYYIADTKTAADKIRLVEFEFSITQAYVLEFGDQYIRFYRNRGQILDGGSPYEIASPFAIADLFDLKFTQSADVLYITHPSYAPRELTRTGHTSWTLTATEFIDGPYLPENQTDTTLTPAATTGTGIGLVTGGNGITNCADNGSGLIRVTAGTHGYETGDKVGIESVTGTTEANGSWTITKVDASNFDLDGSTFNNAYISGGTARDYLFESTDATDGRWVRIQHSSTWGWAKVVSFVHYGSVTVDIVSDFGGTTPVTVWKAGSWTTFLGFPAASTFHEDRHAFVGASSTPQRADLSNSGDYTNFSTSAADGTVVASNAIAATLNAGEVNVARWVTSDEKGLLIGTVGGEWVLRGGTTTEALSPANISAKKSSSEGSANIQPVQAGKATIFVQRARKKLREMTYFFEVDGFRSPDLNVLAEHVTGTGVTELAYMKEPQSILWAVRDDGQLLGMTYERDLDGIRAGWHRHVLGGVSDAANSDAKVESIAIIPSSDNSMYELWMVVQRYVDGSTVRHIEYLTKFFDENTNQQDAFFVDSGLTYDSPINVTGITQANPGVVTTDAHGFANGDFVRFVGVKGMTEVNGDTYKIENKTSTTFELTGLEDTRTDLTEGVIRRWTASSSGTDEYYLELIGGGDPSLTEFDYVQENNSNLSVGTMGSLAIGEWDWGDNDTLGYSTVYVRLSNGNDPDSQAAGYVEGFLYSDIDTSGFSAYVSGGEVRKLVTNISGLTHLEGETVSILADGAVQPNQAVSSGAITLGERAAVVQIGLPYNSDGQLLRLEAGANDGTALGKKRRTHRMGMLVHRSLGLQVGMNFTDLDAITFRTSSDSLTRAPALYTGVLEHRLESDYDFENQIAWRQNQPLPSMVLAVMPQLVTQDRG